MVTEKPAWKVERLRKEHERSCFCSGEPELDEWLRRYAGQNDEKGVGRTFVAVREGESRIWGYHTLRAGSIAHALLPPADLRKLPRYPVPVVHLARLAVDQEQRGQRLGERLLMHALDRAIVVSEIMGIYAVEVVALNDAARQFYLHYGFRPPEDDPGHLYLSIRAIRAAFGGEGGYSR